MLPPLTPLNSSDQEILDALRIERFRMEFRLSEAASLKRNSAEFAHDLLTATLCLSGLDRTLVVSGGREIKALLEDKEHLLREAWSILAIREIAIYSCGSLLWNTLGEKANGDRMATAIQEQDLTQVDVENGIESLSAAQESRIVRSMALADIAADLEADTSALQTFLEEHSATLIRFGETLLVLETDAASAYEHYSVIRARQKMQERFALKKGATTEEKPQALTTKNAAPKESKPKKPTLTFKREFKANKSNYKRTIQNFQNAMFPDNPADQEQALNDIVQQNETGRAYLDKIVRAGDYKDKQHARDLLYKAAAELSSQEIAAPKEDGVETTV